MTNMRLFAGGCTIGDYVPLSQVAGSAHVSILSKYEVTNFKKHTGQKISGPVYRFDASRLFVQASAPRSDMAQCIYDYNRDFK